MILDSEKQRDTLLTLLAQVPMAATMGNIAQQAAAAEGILDPIRTAEIIPTPEVPAPPNDTEE